MMDFVKKGMYMGLGLAAMTKERIDEFAEEFSERAQFTEEEGKKFAEYLQRESETARESLQENIECMINEALEKFPSRQRMRELEARVAALEAVVGQMVDAQKKQEAEQEKTATTAEAGPGPEPAPEV